MRAPIPWQQSVFSDGTEAFVRPQAPELGCEVTVALRLFADAPVTGVWLWSRPDNRESLTPMARADGPGRFARYEARVRVEQPTLSYHFVLGCAGETWYYNQLGLQSVPPLECFDFKLLAGFQRPSWVDRSVFYQVVPDRFRDGDPASNVRDGEYRFDRFAAKARAWDERPGEYEESGCLDFFGGDLPGVVEKLPWLEELGANALYLTPVFRALSHHKYDCMDYFEVDPHLGGNRSLVELSESCHGRGMRLILDISINHTGSAHRWFNREGFYGENSGAFRNPAGAEAEFYLRRPPQPGTTRRDPFLRWRDVDSLVTLNYGSKRLREAIYRSDDSVLKHWLRPPYGVDGWRFDVAYMMARYKTQIFHQEVWSEIRSHLKALNPACYLVSEDWTDATEFLQGDRFDGAMNYFGFARPVRRWCGEPDRYLEGLPGIQGRPTTAVELRLALCQNLGAMPHQIWALQFNLLDSHDWHRLHHVPGLDFETYRGAVALLFTWPGTPCIYYGDEVGIDGHPRSVEGCRYPFPWDEARWNRDHLALYRGLARLRRENRALANGSVVPLLAEGRVFAFARTAGDDLVVTAVSGEAAERRVALPLCLADVRDGVKLHEVFDRCPPLVVKDGWVTVALRPREALVLVARA